MKNAKSILVLAILVSSVLSAHAQQDGITSAFQTGDASALKTFFAKSVDLTLPEMEGTFPSERATSVMKDFFTKNPVRKYKVVHVSTPQQGRAEYSIAELTTDKGVFRTTIYFDESKKITEIRIQE